MTSAAKSRKKPRIVPKWAQHLLILAVIGLSLLVAWNLLPKGTFSTDLDLIGQGQPIAVLIHETASPNSMEAMELINSIRHEVKPQLDFLVASLGHPDGEAFAQEQQTESPGFLLFFDSEGNRTHVVFVRTLEDIYHGIRSLPEAP